MFVLYWKDTEEECVVYGIAEDSNGYPKFLIRKNEQWLWRSAKLFVTGDELFLRGRKKENDNL